jgi:7,8-dihydropterin-6-yl-methyl-4-(beta-D-ribofuranosyl)aminobenzene 5'-phosphate synthase
VEKPRQIAPGIWLTGPVPRKYPEQNWTKGLKRRTSSGLVDDNVAEDMSLIVETDRGLVVLTGCGHAGIVNIVTHARQIMRNAPVYAVIGGMHLYEQDTNHLDWAADELHAAGVKQILAAHCTGIEATMHLRRRLGLTRKTAPVGAVGATFDLEKGINAGDIAR